jgi:carboxypeptidase N regulatory subunit
LKILGIKKMSLPRIAVLATGAIAALLVATVGPAPAQATPSQGITCAGCHTGAGGSVTATPSTLTPAAGAAFTVAINITSTATGNAGYNLSLAGTSVTTGGPAAATTFTANVTAPAAAGTYVYTVGANQGPPGAGGQASQTTFSITVAAGPTTVPPTTVPPTTVPPTTVPPTIVPTTIAPVTAGVIPAGAPATGAGGSAEPNVSPLVGLGGLALLLAGASATQITRRRRQV